MKNWLFSLIVATAAFASYAQAVPPSFVEYRDHKLLLAKHYKDFDEYKNDPNNLPAEALKKAEALIRGAPFGRDFSSSQALSDGLASIQFPGYGSFYANQVGSNLNAELEFVYVEIPGGRFNRYFALHKNPSGAYEVADDFVAPQDPEITRVRKAKSGGLEYTRSNGEVIVPARR